ncbi:MAG: hypothetical protein ACLGXA_01275 [Acidobacteriota bacterium]
MGEALLSGEDFKPSENDYDWLGSGIYFWETNPRRGLDWAMELQKRKAKVTDPFVVGAVVDLGFCLDLISSNGTEAVKLAWQSLHANMERSARPLPSNAGGVDLLLRRLDCAVINHLHKVREVRQLQPFDSVRGVFIEGPAIYDGAGFREKTHIQICVRSPERIKGVFRVRSQDL